MQYDEHKLVEYFADAPAGVGFSDLDLNNKGHPTERETRKKHKVGVSHSTRHQKQTKYQVGKCIVYVKKKAKTRQQKKNISEI